MKKLLFFICFSIAFSAVSFSQQIKYAAPVPHTDGVPDGTPTSYNSWLRYDKTNGKLYVWRNEAWAALDVSITDGGTTVYLTSTSDRLAIGATSATEKLDVTGNIRLTTAGNKLKIATGSNASVGTSTLVGGTVTVSTTAVATGSLIYVSRNTSGGTAGHLNAPSASIVNGTSFVINSSSGTDTSTVNWWIVN
jgi:hypothetical protein